MRRSHDWFLFTSDWMKQWGTEVIRRNELLITYSLFHFIGPVVAVVPFDSEEEVRAKTITIYI